MRAGLILLLAVGCGGPSKPQPTPVTTPPPSNAGSGSAATATPVAEATPARVCKRMMELKAQSCGAFAGLPFDEPQCIAEIQKAGDDPTLKVFTGCVIQPSCEEVKNCLTAASDNANQQQQQDLRACTDPPGMSAVGIPAAEWDKRNGAGVRKLSQAKSSKAQPIEMCGIPDENAWLVSLSCDDGSQPIQNAETARVGNVGSGGRCGSIIDEYRVKCPEKTYDIFIDAYICPTK